MKPGTVATARTGQRTVDAGSHSNHVASEHSVLFCAEEISVVIQTRLHSYQRLVAQAINVCINIPCSAYAERMAAVLKLTGNLL